jgi:peptidoglycan/LPS O-acetylase OafA/YrhL
LTATAGEQPIPALDGWRGLAALVVLVSHVSNGSGLWHGLLGQGAGQTGVMLFFVLSGYLMTRLHAGTAFTAAHIRHYAIRRLARVYPLFAVVAAALVVRDWLGGTAGFTHGCALPVLRQWSLIDPGISVLWTVRVEIIFYVAFLAIWFAAARAGRWVTIALLTAAVAVLSLSSLRYTGMVGATFRYFLFGVISALAQERTATSRAWVARATAAATLLALAALPLTYPLVARAVLGSTVDPWHNDWAAAEVVLLFNLVLRDRGPVGGFLSTRPARWLGRISYSLYALQPLVLDAVFARLAGANPLLAASTAIPLMLGAAQASHHLVERPAQRAILRTKSNR